jgi:hypothetical protein
MLRCVHCNGTGFCTHAILKYDQNRATLWMECDICGKSNIGKYSWARHPEPNNRDIEKAKLKKIYCRACGARGY